MAYPETCAGALLAIKRMCTSGSSYSEKASVHALDAKAHWLAGQDHLAIEDLISACLDLHESTAWLAFNYDPFAYEGAIHWYLTHCIEAPPLTMSAILDAMLNAEPHQPLLFIAYLEAYKASVWNATFDERFFADLVKKWLIWG